MAIYVLEERDELIAGETGVFAVDWGQPVSSTSVLAYLNGQDVTTTIFPSGSDSASGNVQVSKPYTGFIGGNVYPIVFTATVNGYTKKVLLQISVKDPKEE